MYIKKTYELGEVVEVMKYCSGNYGAPGCSREPKRKQTPEKVTKQNRANRVRFMQRLLIANFWEGGWHVVLTYRKGGGPGDIGEAKRRVREFCGNMREAYRKAGHEFRYICVTEIGSRGAAHHHLVIEDIATEALSTKREVAEFWGYGSAHYTSLYQEGEYRELAEYLVKEEGKEGQRCRYTRSRNLIVPQPRKEKVRGRKWEEEPQPEKGWHIIRDSLVNGMNPATGLPYQRYMMRRLGKEAVSADGRDKDVRGDVMEKPGKAGWRGDVACGMHEARGAHNQAGNCPRRKWDRGPGSAAGAGRCPQHTEEAMPHKGIHKLSACIGRCAERLASAVEGSRMGKRKREAGEERGSMGGIPGKRRPPYAHGSRRKP